MFCNNHGVKLRMNSIICKALINNLFISINIVFFIYNLRNVRRFDKNANKECPLSLIRVNVMNEILPDMKSSLTIFLDWGTRCQI